MLVKAVWLTAMLEAIKLVVLFDAVQEGDF